MRGKIKKYRRIGKGRCGLLDKGLLHSPLGLLITVFAYTQVAIIAPNQKPRAAKLIEIKGFAIEHLDRHLRICN
ncbi:MAG: hypothetical protein M3Q58_01330, partial [Bacteroidota bacterium]|nr:hypothetical protein [Bacteroidota bacterium]